MERLWVKQIESDYKKWESLLHCAGLRPENLVSETYGYFSGENLVATGSIFENIIKCVAVQKDFQGGEVFNELISLLISRIYEQGYSDIYVYTKPKSEKSFSYIGFKTIETVDDKLVFMEKSTHGFTTYIKELEKNKSPKDKSVGAIVVNANPFTNGHLYLVEEARKQCDELHIFVVSEDKSVFDYETRLKLIKLGTTHLTNLYFHSTKSYLVSSQTFPSYFLSEDADITTIHATLDSKIFKNHIAPALNIDTRFVGDEPFSKPTNIYNQAMLKVFSDDPKLIIIPRLEKNNTPISASTVRNLIAEDKLLEIESLVPKTTFEFLKSKEAEKFINALKNDPLKGHKESDIK